MSKTYWMIGSILRGTQELIETSISDEEVLKILKPKQESKK